MIGWARRHERLAVSTLYLVMLALWFPGLFAGEQMGQSHVLWSHHPWAAERPAALDVEPRNSELDAALTFHPLLREARAQLGEGRLPLWNPYSYAGMPLLGDWQSGILHPLSWPMLLLGIEPLWGFTMLAKLLIAGLGTFALARRFGIGAPGAALAGLIFMLGAPNVVWLQWPLATVFCVFPWLILATDSLVRAPSGRRTAAVAALVGLGLVAGHPESALLSTSASAVYGAALLFALRRSVPRLPVARAAAAWLGAHVLGVALAAGEIAPFMQAWSESISRETHGVIAGDHLPAWSAIVYALPNLFGDGKPLYNGPPLGYLIVAGYVGITTLLLAGVGLARSWRRPEAMALAAMGVLALMVIFGVPPVTWVMDYVPPWSSGNNARVFYIVAVPLAVGAGAGLEALLARPLAVRRALLVVGAAGAVVAVWALALLALDRLPAERAVELRAGWRFGLALLAAGGLLLAAGRLRAPLVVAFAIVIVAGDVAYLRGWNPVLPAAQAYPRGTPAVRALQAAGPGRVVGVWPGVFPPFALPPNTGMLYRLGSVQGYDFPPARRLADVSLRVWGQRGVTRELIFNVSPKTDRAGLTALRMLNVRFYLTPPGAASPAAGLRRRYSGPDAEVWEDPGALPPAFLVGRERRLDEAGSLAALVAGRLDPRREVLVPPGAPRASAGPATLRPAPLRRVAPDRLRIRVPAGGGGWLVVGEGYWRSYRAKVDGRTARVVPADHVAMAVAVPRGARVVELSRSRAANWTGLGVAGAALLLTGGLALTGRRRA